MVSVFFPWSLMHFICLCGVGCLGPCTFSREFLHCRTKVSLRHLLCSSYRFPFSRNKVWRWLGPVLDWPVQLNCLEKTAGSFFFLALLGEAAMCFSIDCHQIGTFSDRKDVCGWKFVWKKKKNTFFSLRLYLIKIMMGRKYHIILYVDIKHT